MATYYLKNTSGTTVTLRDLGIVLQDNTSLPIDSNDITGWLTPDMADALNTPSDLILGTTDIGDSSGDFTPAEAILALSLVSKFDRDNPTRVTFTQAVDADPLTDITAAEAEELTNGSSTLLHNHNGIYYTQTQLSTSNPGTVNIHWDNIINTPNVGAPEWQEPALCIVVQTSQTPPAETVGNFYMDTDNNHLYKYDGSIWVDQGAPNIGDRFINNSNDEIYEWNGSQWITTTPQVNWSVLIKDDGDGKGAQYVYDGTDWIKIADVDWGTHDSIGGRDVINSHPGTAISYNNTISGLAATNIQNALDELAVNNGVDISNLIIVAKNGDDNKTGVILGTIANPYSTIQRALNSVPTSGLNAATAINPYLIVVMPGQYEENVNHSKEFTYIIGWDKESTIISSSSADTLTIATTGNKSSGIRNITTMSTSSDASDNALVLTGNEPQIVDVDVITTNGARAVYILGAYNYYFNNVRIIGGIFRIDNGSTQFITSSVSGAQTVITNGSLLIREGRFQFANGDVITQSGGTVRFIFGKIESNGTFKDYNQSSGSIAWGWIDCDNSKLVFNGNFELIFKSKYLSYNNITSGLTATNVQDAIDQIDANIDSTIVNINNHSTNQNNPHNTTFTQVVAADPGTDITTAEAETLTNGSNADLLHHHNAINTIYNKNTVDILEETNVQAALDYIAQNYKVQPKNVIFVAKNGNDTPLPNGHSGSAGAPYLTIQAAINRIEFNNDNTMDNPYMIWIGPGLYEETVILNDNRLDNLLLVGNNSIMRSTGDAIRSSLMNGGLSTIEFENLLIDGRIYFEGALNAGNTFEAIAKFSNCEIKKDIVGKNIISLEFEDSYINGNTTIENVSDIVFKNVKYESGNTIGLVYNELNPKPINCVQTHFNVSDSNIKANLTIGQGCTVETFNSTIGSTSSSTVINGSLITQDGWLGAGSTSVNAVGALTTRGTFFNKQTLTINPSGVWTNETRSNVVYYNNNITQIPADNVQDAIDNLKFRIDAFKIPKGTVFPSNPETGDLFYRTDLSITYQYDGSRGKWLSTTQMTYDFGSNNADGKYLNIHGAAATMTGYLMPRGGTIIALTAKIASGNQTKTIEIRRNSDSANPLKSFVLTGGTYLSVTENIDFEAGDYLQSFVVSSGVPARDIVVVYTIVWRG